MSESAATIRHCACAILIANGRILLGKRAPHRLAYPDCWDIIGGGVEAGESVEAALIRELGEELGVTPLAFAPLATIDDFHSSRGPAARYHIFTVTAWHGDVTMLGDEHTELAWFTPDTAAALKESALDAYRELFRTLRV